MTLLIYSEINIVSVIVFGGSKIVNLRNKTSIYPKKCAIRKNIPRKLWPFEV